MLTLILKKEVELRGMKAALQTFGKQAWPILLSALAAGGVAFLQAAAAHAGLCPAPTLSAADTSALGGIIKAGHQSVVYLTGGNS